MSTARPNFRSQDGRGKTEQSRAPAPENRSPNSACGFLVPNSSKLGPSCLAPISPPLRWCLLGETVSEVAASLFSFKLLLHKAASSATDPRLEGPALRAAHSGGPHLLLPGGAHQWPLQ